MSWRSAPLPPGWARIREDVLRRDGYQCQWGSLPEDGAQYGQCAEPANEVDHTGAPGDHRSEALRALCHRHHVKRSASQGVAARASIRARNPRNRPQQKHPGFKDGTS